MLLINLPEDEVLCLRPPPLNSCVIWLIVMALLPRNKNEWWTFGGCLIATVPFAYILRLALSYLVGIPYFLSVASRGREFILWLNTSLAAFLVCYFLAWALLLLWLRRS